MIKTYMMGYMGKEASSLFPGGSWAPGNFNLTEFSRRALNKVGPGGLALGAGALAFGLPYAAKAVARRLIPERGTIWNIPGAGEVPVTREELDEINPLWAAAPLAGITALLAASNYAPWMRKHNRR